MHFGYTQVRVIPCLVRSIAGARWVLDVILFLLA